MTGAMQLPAERVREEPAIATADLVVRYGRRRAVEGLTLRVPRGSVYGLLGGNGGGKTTTMRALLGFRGRSSGSVHILGYDVARDRLEINARIGFVSETNSLYQGMTVPQLCAFFRATSRRWNQALVDRSLHLFGLPTATHVRQLSKGMKTQLALCLALGGEPDLLILDEPTTGHSGPVPFSFVPPASLGIDRRGACQYTCPYSLSARKPLGLSQGMNGVLTCRFLA